MLLFIFACLSNFDVSEILPSLSNCKLILSDNIDVAKLKESKLRPLRNNFQIVFQDPYRSLNPRRTVGQSIIEGPTNFGVPLAEATQRAKDLMNIVGLQTDSLERFPHQFSGGYRRAPEKKT